MIGDLLPVTDGDTEHGADETVLVQVIGAVVGCTVKKF